MTQPAPSGFGQYQQTQSTSSSSGQASFPTQYSSVPYPGVTSQQLRVTVPGSGTPGYSTGQVGPGEHAADFPIGTGGDQSLEQMLTNLITLQASNPDAIPQLQDKLIEGGFLNPFSRSYMPGTVQPGDATWGAYRDLLLASAGSKTAWNDLLDTNVQNQLGAKKFNLQTTSDKTQLTNPQDARQALAQVMEQELGRKPMNSEISQYIANLQQQEANNPTHDVYHWDLSAALNQGNGGAMAGALGYGVRSLPKTTVETGGTNPTTVAENQVMQNNGQELAQTKADGVYQLFLHMLNGQGSVA